MKTRIRTQQVTVKPRVIVNGDSFKVEYFGPITKGDCGTSYPTLEAAIEYANSVARRNPRAVETINRQRNAQRLARLARKQAVKDALSAYGFPVAA